MNCRHCQTSLQETDLESGVCPDCGRIANGPDSTVSMPSSCNLFAAGLAPFLPAANTDGGLSAGDPIIHRIALHKRVLRRADDDPPGEADYELKEVLGKGGMGVVYAARQTAVDRMIAVKVMSQEAAANEQNRHKFVAEAVVTSDLDHPGIVPVYELAQNTDGTLFYAMKRVRGVPWQQVMRQKSETENIDILLRVADAVAFAHSRGVIHRDLKPVNVMLGDYGEVLVMDWGMATTIDALTGRDPLAWRGIGGTPAYMPPEMAVGDVARIGVVSDVYLLGAILFEIVTGYPPHPGRTASEYLNAALRNEIRPIHARGEHIDIALKAMSTEVSERYRDVKEFQAAVRGYVSHAESVALAERAGRETTRAQQTRRYEDFAQALFSYKEAMARWPENPAVRPGFNQARRDYARCALDRGDLDLALSLVDKTIAEHQDILAGVEEVRRAERWKHRRQQQVVYLARTLVGLIILVVAGAFVWVLSEKGKAEYAWQSAKAALQAEERHRHTAEMEQSRAREAEHRAIAEKEKVVAAQRLAAEQEHVALQAGVRAESERQKALVAEQAELASRQKAKQAEVAVEAAQDRAIQHRLSAVRAKAEVAAALRENAETKYSAQLREIERRTTQQRYDEALTALAECPEELRGWEWGYYRHRAAVEQRLFTGHRHSVTGVSLAPDGRWIAAGAADGAMLLWDVDGARPPMRIAGENDDLIFVDFIDDGRALLSVTAAGLVTVWNGSSGEKLRAVTLSHPRLTTFTHANGSALWISGYENGDVEIWDGIAMKHRTTMKTHQNRVNQIATGDDAARFFTIGADRAIRQWQTGGRADAVDIAWPAKPGEERWKSPSAATGALGGAGASDRYDRWIGPPTPTAPMAVSMSAGVTVFGQLTVHEFLVQRSAIALSDKRDRLIIGGDDGTISFWDLRSERMTDAQQGHGGRVNALAISTDGYTAVSVGADGIMVIWDAMAYKPRMRIEAHHGGARALRLSTDGAYAVTGGHDGSVRLWNVQRGRTALRLTGHNAPVVAAAMSRGGTLAATADAAGNVLVWSLFSGQIRSRFTTPETGPRAMEFTVDGARLFISARGVTTIWEWSSGTRLATIGNDGSIQRIDAAFDPTTVVQDNRVAITRIRSAAESNRMTSGIAFPLYAPAGDVALLPGLTGMTVSLWDSLTGTERLALVGHAAEIRLAIFSPDSKRIVTAAADGVMKVWSAATGLELLTLHEHQAAVVFGQFSPDGAILITGDTTGECVVLKSDINGME